MLEEAAPKKVWPASRIAVAKRPESADAQSALGRALMLPVAGGWPCRPPDNSPSRSRTICRVSISPHITSWIGAGRTGEMADGCRSVPPIAVGVLDSTRRTSEEDPVTHLIHRRCEVPADLPAEELPRAAIADLPERDDLQDWQPLARTIRRAECPARYVIGPARCPAHCRALSAVSDFGTRGLPAETAATAFSSRTCSLRLAEGRVDRFGKMFHHA